MRWLKFTADGQTSWGIVENDRVIAVSGDPFGEWQCAPRTHALAEVKIELPLMPRTFYCVGLNYLKHPTEAANKRGEVPNVPDRPEIGYRAQNAPIADCGARKMPTLLSRWGRGSKPKLTLIRWKPSSR